MRTRRYKLPSLLAALLLLLIIDGCTLKELNEDAPTTIADRVDVVFDWSKVTDPQATTMILYLYPEGRKVMDYRFNNPAGGTIRTYAGSHTAVCHSNDDPYVHLIRNEHIHDGFEIFTDNTALLVGQGLSTRGIPRAEGTEDEPLRNTPTMIYGIHDKEVELRVTQQAQTLTLYPEELVCHYAVEFLEVANLKSNDIRIDGTISSLAGGFYPGRMTSTSEAVSHTFTLTPDVENRMLRAEFLTFGLPDGEELPHKLCLYVAQSEKKGSFFTFDVSQQVNTAPDPRNVTIRITGFQLPDIEETPSIPSGTTGLTIDIDSWDTYHFNLKF